MFSFIEYSYKFIFHHRVFDEVIVRLPYFKHGSETLLNAIVSALHYFVTV